MRYSNEQCIRAKLRYEEKLNDGTLHKMSTKLKGFWSVDRDLWFDIYDVLENYENGFVHVCYEHGLMRGYDGWEPVDTDFYIGTMDKKHVDTLCPECKYGKQARLNLES